MEQLGVTLANWQEAPYNRWAFRHVSEMVPTAQISRGSGTIWDLPRAPRDLLSLRFEGASGAMSVGEMLHATYTDGFVVLEDGVIVCERYLNGTDPADKHLLMSVSKSLTGMLAGVLVEHGLLELTAPCGRYVPELEGSAYADATVQEALDMTVSVIFREEYTDPDSEVQAQDRAAGWRPALPGDPPGIYHFLPNLKKDREHGVTYQYCSATTDVLGWVLERASSRRFADLFGQELWSRLGAEHDAYITVDRSGATFPNGGICVTARDLARFGQLVLQNGFVGLEEVVPSRWIEETRRGSELGPWPRDPEGTPGPDNPYPNGSYHNQWYLMGDEHDCMSGSGIHGQHLWIDPAAGAVIAKVSSRPQPIDQRLGPDTLAAFTAIGQALL
jgi:CubicO group peptidase (beta-lactamase class C family)